MWEKRVQQLLARYGKVHIEEYRKVENQLKQLQASLKDTVPRSELVQVSQSLGPKQELANHGLISFSRSLCNIESSHWQMPHFSGREYFRNSLHACK